MDLGPELNFAVMIIINLGSSYVIKWDDSSGKPTFRGEGIKKEQRIIDHIY